MSEQLINGIYNDAYYAAMNAGASDSEAEAYASQCCKDLQSQLTMFD